MANSCLLVPKLRLSSLYTSPAKPTKAVISAGMPKTRPWTVISRLCKCLIQVTCHTVASCSRLQGHLSWPRVCHPWTLDSGIPAGMTSYNSSLLAQNENCCLLFVWFDNLIINLEVL